MQNHLKDFNIGVFISGGGTNLQALIDASKRNVVKSSIKCVISSSANAYGLVRAQENEIACLVSTDENEILRFLSEHQINLIFLAGYLREVGSEILSQYPGKILNIHPSLLPLYGGKGMYGIHVHEAVFQNKEEISGATIHFVNSIIDGGEILLQEKIPIKNCKSPKEIQQQVIKLEHELMVKAIKKLEEQ